MPGTATRLHVRVHDEAPPEWDPFIGSAPDSTIYHLGAWGRVIARTFGHQVKYATAVDDHGVWHGALQLVHVRSRLLGGSLMSLPFLNGGGPIGSPAACAMLVDWSVDEACRLSVRSMELRCRQANAAGRARYSARKVLVLLDLEEDADLMFAGLHPKLRANVRKAGRAGLHVEHGHGELPAFYEAFARNMRDLGTPVLPMRFFEHVVDQFRDHVLVGAVHADGRPILGQLSLTWRNELEMVWGGSLREYSHRKVTSLVHWEYMRLAIERGLRTFNFGRCTPGSGNHEFKVRWGGRTEVLPWLYWSPNGRVEVPSTDSLKLRLAVEGWKRLPLAVANRVGPSFSAVLP